MLIDKYKHISFDLDGTLAHTAPEYRYKIVPATISQLGGSIKDKYHIDRFWFEHDRDNIIQECFNLDPEVFWAVFKKLDTAESRNPHARAYNDAEPAIRKLKEFGKTISIITGSPPWIAEMEISKLNGAPYNTQLSLGCSDEIKMKPEPHGLIYIMKKMSVMANETLYIGNSKEDAMFAKNAGVDFIHIERDEHPFDLKEYAVATITSLSELFV